MTIHYTMWVDTAKPLCWVKQMVVILLVQGMYGWTREKGDGSSMHIKDRNMSDNTISCPQHCIINLLQVLGIKKLFVN